ncbi:hypothetical protein UFOVP1492_63 [uncultured Caudovirales phage]|uniref:Uncharacterized protein n=1 Tax=uncultured Caudovirales phage TaxID=2100421 RepID=A0A6J7XPM0_9CAUD|nr:hypothetical protein UFOVP1492_63 [uncultured Caudovirales phage]CAB5231493.1 hypothetical protein UFOVP1580_92 [uncultured Caudovirales phage]
MDDRTPKELSDHVMSVWLPANQIRQGDFLSETTGLEVYTRIYKRDSWGDQQDVLYGRNAYGGDSHFLSTEGEHVKEYRVITIEEMRRAGYDFPDEPIFYSNLSGYKRKVRFKDGEGKIVRAGVEVRRGDNSYKKNWHDLSPVKGPYATFSASFDRDSCMGQTGFVPGNAAQKRFHEIWEEYHLNDMKAGTKAQTKALASADFTGLCERFKLRHREMFDKEYAPITAAHKAKELARTAEIERRIAAGDPEPEKNLKYNLKPTTIKLLDKSIPTYKEPSDYDMQRSYLDLKGLSAQYKYGSAWLLAPLDEMFTTNLALLLDEIESIEAERVSEIETAFKGTIQQIMEGDKEESDDDLLETDLGEEWKRKVALASHLGLSYQDCFDIEVDDGNSARVSYSGEEYLVCDDTEMEDRWDESLESYLDECVLPELDESVRRYFDKAAWKSDAREDSVGHSLNYYDGTHHTITVEDNWNIFRQ